MQAIIFIEGWNAAPKYSLMSRFIVRFEISRPSRYCLGAFSCMNLFLPFPSASMSSCCNMGIYARLVGSGCDTIWLKNECYWLPVRACLDVHLYHHHGSSSDPCGHELSNDNTGCPLYRTWCRSHRSSSCLGYLYVANTRSICPLGFEESSLK